MSRTTAIRARFLPRELDHGLERLSDLALDLRWTWSRTGDAFWSRLDPETWRRTENPWLILQAIPKARLDALASNDELVQEIENLVEARNAYQRAPGWFGEAPRATRRVAFFSLEFGLGDALPLYAGGLGVLAGDFLKTASDLAVPLVGVGLLYQEGYFRQTIDAEGRQREVYPVNDPTTLPIQPVTAASGEWLRVPLELPGREVILRVWVARIGRVRLYLLDSNDPLNSPTDRGITGKLYGGGREARLLQEMVLGIGGFRLLEALGLEVDVCHLNEGHAAFVVLERARRFARRTGLGFEEALWATRVGNVFTTHTPIGAGIDRFPAALMKQYFEGYGEAASIPLETLLALGRPSGALATEPFNMAFLALRGSAWANAVSELHGTVSRKLFSSLYPRWPEAEVPIGHVTNGVHVPSWDSRGADELWTRTCGKGRWTGSLEGICESMCCADDDSIWALRTAGRIELVRYARERLALHLGQRGAGAEEISKAAHVLDPNALTLGFARRFAEYKRPNLLLRDEERLIRLLTSAERPVQLIVAGKAHPDDDAGKRLVEAWTRFARRPEARDHVVFLEDYDIALAQHLVQGVDVWLNTPRRLFEACGTSGMKVLANGGLNLSELDGWWSEAASPQVGWTLRDGDGALADEHASSRLHEILETEVVPEFYERDGSGIPRRWIAKVRASMSQLAPRFSSNRMLREYVETIYEKAAGAFARRASESGRSALELRRWSSLVEESWHGVRFGEISVERSGESWRFTVPVYLGDLSPEAVSVELYADAPSGGEPVRLRMTRASPIAGSVFGFVYVADAPASRPSEHYTPRVVPFHPEARIPSEAMAILWAR